MNLLLDTPVAAWGWTLDGRLGRTWHERLVTSSVFISAITPWEMGIKHAAGRWPEAKTILDRWDSLLEESGYQPIAISSRHALHAAALDWSHRDPFDRMLVAQAQLEGAVLVTADPWMLAFLPDALDATQG